MRLRAPVLGVLLAFVATCNTSSLEELSVPIRGITLADLRDMYKEEHNGHTHEAIDIMEPRGTAVRAVVRGTIQKLFLSKPGGITIYLFDNREEYCYYYAHLDRYADGLREGMRVEPGDIIGYVGSTGNAHASAPHLHFAITELGREKRWWKGKSLDPYPWLVAAVKRNQ